MQRVRILIADDEPALRDAIADLIGGEGAFDLVGTAEDAEQAILLAKDHQPDVALLDVKMPKGGGPAAAQGIHSVAPATRMIAFSAYGDRIAVAEMLKAGAVGYLLKGSSAEEILHSIRKAGEGQAPLAPEVAGLVIEQLAAQLVREEKEAADARERSVRIKKVLEGEGLSMVFQPIFDLRIGTVVGQEALARFNVEPSRPPNEWFAEANTVGLGVDLQLAAVRKALENLKDLPPTAFMSVNLAPDALIEPEFLGTITQFPADRIIIEVTEHAPVADYQILNRVLALLRERGMRFAIDDAGAGYASLKHILQIAPEFIKLDISLTRGIDKDSARRALAHALIAFASETGAVMVAEGIETQEELDALRELRVACGQGFYLARPSPLPRHVVNSSPQHPVRQPGPLFEGEQT